MPETREERKIIIDPMSCCSLMIKMVSRGNTLGMATGFVIQHSSRFYLITNWHVVSGINPDTNKLLLDTGEVPDTLSIVHHVKDRLGTWKEIQEPLFDAEGTSLWIEHPSGSEIDVVALPLSTTDPEVTFYPLDLRLADQDIAVYPSMVVSIIGYPLGITTGQAWPIWKTGHIASDPDIDYAERPVFIIDATTRSGMSGSPVVYHTSGPYRSRGGGTVLGSNVVTLFLGIYSGRIGSEAELGRVWRPSVVQEILEVIDKIG